MKHRVVNRTLIQEAFVQEPYEADPEYPFGHTHGWQVCLVMGHSSDGYAHTTVIDKKSEQECIDFIESLGTIFVSAE